MSKESTIKMKNYEVQGAGEIQISTESGWECGTAKDGIHFGVSWGKFGLKYGGVLDKEVALELANDIINIYK